jgi:hypothetical protein
VWTIRRGMSPIIRLRLQIDRPIRTSTSNNKPVGHGRRVPSIPCSAASALTTRQRTSCA